ncbi:MAG: hypothetical protein GY847_10280 [Proteobacteria bacterium]|nr:hypothetical protein [Pseudomonadota bacterium]
MLVVLQHSGCSKSEKQPGIFHNRETIEKKAKVSSANERLNIQNSSSSETAPQFDPVAFPVLSRLERYKAPPLEKEYSMEPVIEPAFETPNLLSLSSADVLFCDIWINLRWYPKIDGGESPLPSEKNYMRMISEYANATPKPFYKEIMGFRPWTHSQFIRSLSRNERRFLGKELVRYGEKFGNRCPDSLVIRIDTGVKDGADERQGSSGKKKIGTIDEYDVFGNKRTIWIYFKGQEHWKFHVDTRIVRVDLNPHIPIIAIFAEEVAFPRISNAEPMKLLFANIKNKEIGRFPDSVNIKDELLDVYSDFIGPVEFAFKNEIWSVRDGQYVGLTDSLNHGISIRRSEDLSTVCSVHRSGREGLFVGHQFKRWKRNDEC